MRQQYDIDLLQQINNSVNLLDYVSEDLTLEKRGDKYFASCPKHVDKTPSLCFYEKDNSFHCFSCGRSGKFLGYLLKYEGLTMDEAVERGLKLASIDPSSLCQSETVKFLKQYRQTTKNVKMKPLSEHPIISRSRFESYKKEYPQLWLDEGITKEAMDRYEIRIDEWGNRIVYPVYDFGGRLINIKGRTMYSNYKELRIMKYMNYFEVGVMDYFQGMHLAYKSVKEKNEIIVFESIKSVMKAYSWGYENCVSAEKHTITDEQLSVLIKLRVNVVFAFDSDVDYYKNDVKVTLDKLKLITNVYIINDRKKLLGGVSAKNSPVDLTKEVWEELYFSKKKII